MTTWQEAWQWLHPTPWSATLAFLAVAFFAGLVTLLLVRFPERNPFLISLSLIGAGCETVISRVVGAEHQNGRQFPLPLFEHHYHCAHTLYFRWLTFPERPAMITWYFALLLTGLDVACRWAAMRHLPECPGWAAAVGIVVGAWGALGLLVWAGDTFDRDGISDVLPTPLKIATVGVVLAEISFDFQSMEILCVPAIVAIGYPLARDLIAALCLRRVSSPLWIVGRFGSGWRDGRFVDERTSWIGFFWAKFYCGAIVVVVLLAPVTLLFWTIGSPIGAVTVAVTVATGGLVGVIWYFDYILLDAGKRFGIKSALWLGYITSIGTAALGVIVVMTPLWR